MAKNVFDKYPNADRIITVQMIAATYCPMIRDSKDLKDSEKRRLWTVFYDKVLKFENPSYNPAPPPAPKPKGSAPSTDKGKHPPAETQPSISQQCAPGANCAQSNNQRGGFTGQIVLGPQPRIPDSSVKDLAAQLALCDSGSTTADPTL